MRPNSFLSLDIFSLILLASFFMRPSGGTPEEAPPPAPVGTETAAEVQWMNMAEALDASEKEDKLFFIDVYTDWCGWCKVMDRETFAQPEVAEFMNKHFHNVKLNAEKDDPVTVNGHDFELVDAGKRQIHTLAYALLDGQLSYPSYVYLTSDFKRIYISKGFKKPGPFMKELEKIIEASASMP